MSWQALSTVTRFKAKNPTEKLLMLLIANYADERGAAFPSQARLAEDGSMDVRTVSRALASLEEQGAIARTQRRRGDGSRSSDEIVILFGRRADAALPTTQPDNLSGSQDDQPDNLSGSTNRAPRREGPGTESGQEPVTDPVEPSPRKPPRGPSAEGLSIAESIWDNTPLMGRKRSGLGDLARAADAALGRGADPVQLIAALAAYYAHPDTVREDYRAAKGVHRMVEQDRWREWIPEEGSGPAGAGRPAAPVSQADVEAGVTRAWRARMGDWQAKGAWKTEYGTRPGQLGCVVPAHVLEEFGVKPLTMAPS